MKQAVRSQRGASLPLALLLFLVCAALSAVVLSAGTAAAGRVAQLHEADQRYYAVTSAAELFRESVDGQTVIIEQDVKRTAVTVVSVADGKTSRVEQPPSFEFEGFRIKGSPDDSGIEFTSSTSSAGLPIMEQAAVTLMGNATSKPDVVWEGAFPYAVKDESRTLDLTASVPGKSSLEEPLKVTVTELVRTDGTVVFTLQNANGSTEGGSAYVLNLACSPDIDTDTSSVEEPLDIQQSGTTRTETRVSHMTKTTTITWTASEITKGAGSE